MRFVSGFSVSQRRDYCPTPSKVLYDALVHRCFRTGTGNPPHGKENHSVSRQLEDAVELYAGAECTDGPFLSDLSSTAMTTVKAPAFWVN